MMHSPVRLPDSVDHDCHLCLRVARAPAKQLPADWLLLASEGAIAIVCDDCAPAAKTAALAPILYALVPIISAYVSPAEDGLNMDPQSRLWDHLGVDAIDRVAIALECEDRFGIAISDAEAGQAETVGDLAELIFAKRNLAAVSAEI
ncbi:phosphopantetheine-binding protein [Sphingobium sp. AN558]|uniref:acyl carrier protein n=1 Tax=Sphingobium sp. AN558 TaxID=3133442 RepID=UPI0030BD524C